MSEDRSAELSQASKARFRRREVVSRTKFFRTAAERLRGAGQEPPGPNETAVHTVVKPDNETATSKE